MRRPFLVFRRAGSRFLRNTANTLSVTARRSSTEFRRRPAHAAYPFGARLCDCPAIAIWCASSRMIVATTNSLPASHHGCTSIGQIGCGDPMFGHSYVCFAPENGHNGWVGDRSVDRHEQTLEERFIAGLVGRIAIEAPALSDDMAKHSLLGSLSPQTQLRRPRLTQPC